MPDSPADGRSPAEGGVEVDVVGVGAGFAGLYLIHRMRRSGLSCVVLESADDIGGTWYWNRYPGARCDIQSLDYSYSFDPELETEWEWSEKYATQPEILRYMHHVADKHDLRRDIRFSTRVEAAEWDDDAGRWTVRTEAGDTFRCRYYVMATGCLSIPKDVDIPGVEDFGGRTFQTGRWPHEEVDFRGRRVAVIGTGSSAIQSIPLIAAQAAELTVFQRTPNFSFPAHNGPIPEEKLAQIRGREAEYREEARWSRGGVPAAMATERMADVDEAERVRRMETAFDSGELFRIMPRFVDVAIDPDTNEVYAEFIRDKIRSIVDDPVTAEKLCPRGYPVGTKRPCLDTGYYETYNQPHVRLHDLRDDPIVTVTEDGLQTEQTTYEFDDLVLATGFDAMTGALVGVDIRGRDGVTLADRWRDGPVTYLGLTAVGFPNLFMVTGPGSPSVLSNMMVSIEQHIDWIGRCIDDLSAAGLETIEPTPTAEAGWVQHTNDCADLSLLSLADSWYMGANVPGKPRVCLPYVGGVDAYRRACDDVAEAGYLGFTRTGPAGAETNDGVVRRLQPDVFMVLDLMAQAGAPAIETLDPATARQFMAAADQMRPPGPAVGEIVDGTLPGADGDLDYRLYRPPTDGPHPLVVYFHGGGWVLGSATSDDPLCRDLCVRSDALVVSVDYRHAPETRFPGAVDDALAAVRWLGRNGEQLGARPGPIVLAGWSAGANLATVAARLVRDEGGPEIAGQLLVTPVTDSDPSTASYHENAEGFGLTAGVMAWFWDHYTDPDERDDPRVAPLRAPDLAGLPPAAIFTAEFDPLRDEGAAYAEALAAAGNDVEHVACRGHVHTSLTQVDMVLSGAQHRATMAEALRRFASNVPAVAR